MCRPAAWLPRRSGRRCRWSRTLGRVFTALAAGIPASLAVEVRGELPAYDVQVLQLAALKGFSPTSSRSR